MAVTFGRGPVTLVFYFYSGTLEEASEIFEEHLVTVCLSHRAVRSALELPR